MLARVAQPEFRPGGGVWRSLVARVVRDDEAAGSNPVTPTIGTDPRETWVRSSFPASLQWCDGPADVRLLLRRPRARHLDDRRPAAAHPGADRGEWHGPEGSAARPLPAPRALGRPHRLDALHVHRALRHGARVRRRDARRRPLLLRQREERARLLGLRVRRAAAGRTPLPPRLGGPRRHVRGRVVDGRLRSAQARADASRALRGRGLALRRGRHPSARRAAGALRDRPAGVRGRVRARGRPLRTAGLAGAVDGPAVLHRLRHGRGPADAAQRAIRRRGAGTRVRRHDRLPARRARVGALGRAGPGRPRLDGES